MPPTAASMADTAACPWRNSAIYMVIWPHGERTILPVQPPENVAVALEQARTQAVELDLLGVILAGDHGLQVNLHAGFRRAPAEQPKRIAGELGFRDERRQSRQQQYRDRPRREPRQQHAVAHQRDAVLHQPESAGDETQRAGGCLAARARKLVVEFRVLEVLQLEGERLLEDHHVDPLSELRTQQ